jgi:hypothetical protein
VGVKGHRVICILGGARWRASSTTLLEASRIATDREGVALENVEALQRDQPWQLLAGLWFRFEPLNGRLCINVRHERLISFLGGPLDSRFALFKTGGEICDFESLASSRWN